jgi:hypothetical protein
MRVGTECRESKRCFMRRYHSREPARLRRRAVEEDSGHGLRFWILAEVSMHLIAATLLAVTALSTPSDEIVLRTGERIAVSGDVTADGSRVVFRATDGTLYSIPVAEIDVEATASPSPTPPRARPARSEAENAALDQLVKSMASKSLSNRNLVVSEDEKRRLLEGLKESRGTPGPVRPYEPLSFDSSESSPKELAGPRGSDEWYWRDRARAHKERVLQRKEDLRMLVEKEQDLSDEIINLLNLGYNGNQFSYQVLSLARVRDQIPYARLEVERAERAYAQFRDDARRQGILPGWLR